MARYTFGIDCHASGRTTTLATCSNELAKIRRETLRHAMLCWLTMSFIAFAILQARTAKGDDGELTTLSSRLADTSDAAWVAEDGSSWSSTPADFSPEPLVSDHLFDDFANRLCGDVCNCPKCEDYHWEFLPRESLYPFYLADTKQSRLAGQWLDASNDSTLLDSTLGGRFGIFRYVNSTKGPFRRGVQLDFEGSAQVRLDMDEEHDVRSVDFRAGVPLSFSFGRFATRIGYYHISCHLGDEFLLKNPGYNRLNYVRDVLLLGGAYWLNDRARVYGEATWAFYSDISEPWEFIFGIEDAPRKPTGLKGSPFYAINARLREEIDFSGSLTVQAGWAWRSSYDTGLLRVGMHYFNGLSDQWSFYDQHEQTFGAGLWYDF